MTGVGDDSRGRSSSGPWLAVGFLLAIGATLALVLTDDLRWVRLAVVAALWAALIGALMAAKYRKAASASEKSAAKAQKIYELELEKEVAARREFELEVEAEARERAEADTREELDALRAELSALRENLQTLFGGEVLWERVALTAQSTRMRSLGEEPRLVTAGEGAETPARLTVGADDEVGRETGVDAVLNAPEMFDNPTELIGRVRDRDSDPREEGAEEPPSGAEPRQRNGTGAAVRTRFVPRPARPPEDSGPVQQPVDPPTRRVRGRPGMAMARASEAANRARAEMSRPRQRPVTDPHAESRNGGHGTGYRAGPGAGYDSGYGGGDHDADHGAEAPAERSRSDQRPVPGRVARSRNPGGHVPSRPVPPPAVENAPTRTQPPVELTRPAMGPASARGPAPKPPIPPRVPRPDSGPPTEVNAPVTNPTDIHPRDTEATDAGPTKVDRAPVDPPHAAPVDVPGESRGAEQTAERTSALEPRASEPNPTLPEEIRDLQGRPGGRRRRAEPDDEREPPASTGRRRRYRADDEPAARAVPAGGGRRRAPEPAPAGDAEEAAEPAGSHAEGRSVSELLAAYGASGGTPRRRRRAED